MHRKLMVLAAASIMVFAGLPVSSGGTAQRAPGDADGDGVLDHLDNCLLHANPDQTDTDADGLGNRCDPDFDQSGYVNIGDLAYMRTHFFSNDPLADLNADNAVNFADLAILKAFFFSPPGPTGVETPGLDARPSNTSCTAPAQPIDGASVAVAAAFPSLPAFASPVALRQPPGDAGTWWVLEQGGVVRSFANTSGVSTSSVVIDISARVSAMSTEEGLLAFAFDPEFPATPHVYLYYIHDLQGQHVGRLSRFVSNDGGLTLDADPAAEEVLLEFPEPYFNHNGGEMHFGADGYLYLSLGDGGGTGDPDANGQDTTTLPGSLLRLDVRAARASGDYAIPPTNPFAGNAKCSSGSGTAACPEIYAWGLRNPWRWSFDAVTGDLWVGDVGQFNYEEVDRVELGGNYGWNIREGMHCYNAATCATAGLIDPVAEYDHTLGQAITGGYVYRGSAISGLYGHYVFGDYGSGRIWGLFDDGAGGLQAQQLIDTALFISSFAMAADGELYLLNYFGGDVYRLGPVGPSHAALIADVLSETGCADAGDPTLPSAGLIPYAPNSILWSDGAVKHRWMGLPDGATVHIDADGDFAFPIGTVLRKDFEIDGKLIETRLLMRHTNGEWAGYTYAWNDAQTEADRVVGGLSRELGNGQVWSYPSGTQCLQCHTQAASFALSPEVAQLNGDFTYPSTGRTANQLATLEHVGVFDAPLPSSPGNLPALLDPLAGGDAEASVRSYWHVNCSQCHRPGGPTPAQMDLRYATPLADANVCNVPPTQGNLGIAQARLITPGFPAQSIIPVRMGRRDAYGMPPLGTNVVHDAGVQLVEDWITALQACP